MENTCGWFKAPSNSGFEIDQQDDAFLLLLFDDRANKSGVKIKKNDQDKYSDGLTQVIEWQK